jgi:hypothetical protein
MRKRKGNIKKFLIISGIYREQVFLDFYQFPQSILQKIEKIF